MSKHQSGQRALGLIVHDLLCAMLREPVDVDDRRLDFIRARQDGQRAADKYLTELVDALGLEQKPGVSKGCRYFWLQYHAESGWHAILSSSGFLGAWADDLEAGATEVALELQAQVESRAAGTTREDDVGDEDADLRQREHASRDARAKAALDRARSAITRIDRIRV